jgi:hypothetical protein
MKQQSRRNTLSSCLSEHTDLFNDDTSNNKSLYSNKSNERIFEIRKSKKLTKDTSNDSFDESDENYTLSEGNKRISADSKVNFNKLNEHEKDDRLKNLSVMITRLRKKIRNLEGKLVKNHSKNTKDYINSELSLNGKDNNFDIDYLIKALKVIKNHNEHDYEDEKNVLENFIILLAEEKIMPDSIHFKKICSQIRLFLEKEKINFIAKKGQKIIYSFKERDVYITPQEFEYYKEYKNNEKAIRAILGINSLQNDQTEKITFSHPEVVSSENDMKAPFPKTNRNNPLISNLMSLYSNTPQVQSAMANQLYLSMFPLFRGHMG